MNRNILIIGAVVIAVGLFIFIGSQRSSQQEASDPTTSSPQAEALYQQAQQLAINGQKVEAKAQLNQLMMEYPDYEKVEDVQNQIFDLNMDIIFSNIASPHAVTHEVISGDTLGKLAQRHGTTIELIKTSNDLKNDIIRVGQRLRIWNKPFHIHVDKSQNILMLLTDDEVIKTYSVSTGKNNITPIGDFTVVTKLVDPVWFNRGAIVAPDSPANVLGSRWLGFDIKGYGIHGTIEPETIGQQATAGCVRMLNEEVEELYAIIPIGTKVKVVD